MNQENKNNLIWTIQSLTEIGQGIVFLSEIEFPTSETVERTRWGFIEKIIEDIKEAFQNAKEIISIIATEEQCALDGSGGDEIELTGTLENLQAAIDDIGEAGERLEEIASTVNIEDKIFILLTMKDSWMNSALDSLKEEIQ